MKSKLKAKSMYKILAGVGTLLFLFVAMSGMVLALAPEGIELEVNGKTISSDVPPELREGRVLVPVRWVAEAFGADVRWNDDTRSVSIQTGDLHSSDIDESESTEARRMNLLEQALQRTAASPEETVNVWAKAVQDRNGAAQFALLTDELQEKTKASYEHVGWVTGVSSPWVSDYAIRDLSAEGEATREFGVEFQLQTSTGPAGLHAATLTLAERDGVWRIAELRGGPNGIPDLIPKDLHTDDTAVRDMIDQMEIGRTMGEMEERFGAPNAEMYGAKDGSPMWRYDIPAEEGYVFEGMTVDGTVIDTVDGDGLEQGKLSMQMFVTWDEADKASGYSLYYKGKDGIVYHFHLAADGKVQLK